MDFEVVEVYMLDKTVLRKSCPAVFLKIIDIDVKPYRRLKVECVTHLVKCIKYLLGSVDVIIIIAYNHIAYKMIVLEFFSP